MWKSKTDLFKKLENVRSSHGQISIELAEPLSNSNQVYNLDSNSAKNDFIQKPVTILKRPAANEIYPDDDVNKIIFPKMPFHIRWQLYHKKRDEIFNKSDIFSTPVKKPKRSTKRYRTYFKIKKLCSKLLVSTIVANPKEIRYNAKVPFWNFNELGLIDTGANISCIDSDLALTDFTTFSDFNKIKSSVRTADGSAQAVYGWIEVNISFKGQTNPLRLFIIPNISQKLILGIDRI